EFDASAYLRGERQSHRRAKARTEEPGRLQESTRRRIVRRWRTTSQRTQASALRESQVLGVENVVKVNEALHLELFAKAERLCQTHVDVKVASAVRCYSRSIYQEPITHAVNPGSCAGICDCSGRDGATR